MIRDICQTYEEIDLLKARLNGSADYFLNREETKKLLEDRLDISFNYKVQHKLEKIKTHLHGELVISHIFFNFNFDI